MVKKIFIFFIITFLIVFGFLVFYFRKTEKIKAGTAENISGWAWSENIGWISFNCTNQGTCGTVDYGVNIDETTGDFSGYAWSEHIGWIRFDPPADFATGLYPSDPQYSAKLDFGTAEISGWARACAGLDDAGDGIPNNCEGPTRTDGWDGWIKLRGWTSEAIPTEYGVWLDNTVSPKEFRGWAWGEEVVGWISFNCVDGGYDEGTGTPYSVCATSDYKVITSLSLPPTAENLSVDPNNPGYICGITGYPAIHFSWQFADQDVGDSQSAYQIQIDDDPTFTSPEVDTLKVISPSSEFVNNSSLISWGTTYYWRLKVWDSTDTPSSDWIYPPNDPLQVPYPTPSPGTSFASPVHSYPYPDFTFSPLSPSAGEIVNFTDNSTCYDPVNNPYPCSNLNPITGTYNTYLWDFGDGTTTTTIDGVSYVYSTAGNYNVTLSITDEIPATCSLTQSLRVTFPLPEWREIPPF